MIKGSTTLAFCLLVILVVFLPGCTIFSLAYFRNYSDKSVELVFATNNLYEENNATVEFKNEILPISKNTFKKLNDTLQMAIADSNAYLTIPPHSTVLLPLIIALHTEKIFFRQGNRFDSVTIANIDSTGQHFQSTKKGFPKRDIYYYDYR